MDWIAGNHEGWGGSKWLLIPKYIQKQIFECHYVGMELLTDDMPAKSFYWCPPVIYNNEFSTATPNEQTAVSSSGVA